MWTDFPVVLGVSAQMASEFADGWSSSGNIFSPGSLLLGIFPRAPTSGDRANE